MSQASGLCDDGRMQAILAAADGDSSKGVAAVDVALADYPYDPRLHFLKGSLLIGLKRFVEAHDALSRAVEIAPDFALARFQLGFFELTSGEAEAAVQTWRPLHGLAPEHWMLSFVIGLEHLIADRFAECIAALRAGIAANNENLPLNHDMQLIIAKCEELIAENAADAGGEGQADVSATSLLLRSAGPGTKQ